MILRQVGLLYLSHNGMNFPRKVHSHFLEDALYVSVPYYRTMKFHVAVGLTAKKLGINRNPQVLLLHGLFLVHHRVIIKLTIFLQWKLIVILEQ